MSHRKVECKFIWLPQILQYQKWQIVELVKSLENHLFSKIALHSSLQLSFFYPTKINQSIKQTNKQTVNLHKWKNTLQWRFTSSLRQTWTYGGWCILQSLHPPAKIIAVRAPKPMEVLVCTGVYLEKSQSRQIVLFQMWTLHYMDFVFYGS
mgnify:CR=1 FL=1